MNTSSGASVAPEISSDPARLDMALIHGYLARDSYWAQGIPRAMLAVPARFMERHDPDVYSRTLT